MSQRPHIRIYPHGTRQTDYSKAEELTLKSPDTFKAAQVFLVATEKFIRRFGWFVSQKERWGEMILAYENFISALDTELLPSEDFKNQIGFRAEQSPLEEILSHIGYDKCGEENMRRAAIFYLNEMSAAAPNWQEVYAYLDWFIWEQVPEL